MGEAEEVRKHLAELKRIKNTIQKQFKVILNRLDMPELREMAELIREQYEKGDNGESGENESTSGQNEKTNEKGGV